jgi:aminopeptidase N
VNATYLRGASFLDALRLTLGDDAFFKFLDQYGTGMSGKIAKSEDFWRILATISPAENWEGLRLDYFGE